MKIRSQKIVFECPIMIVEEREVEHENGFLETYWVVIRQPNVTVAALTDDKLVVFIKEQRNLQGGALLDFPGGKLESFFPTIEEIKHKALDELRTETGYRANSLELIKTEHPNASWYERDFYFFAAWNLDLLGQSLERGEKISVVLHPASEISELLHNIPTSPSLPPLLAAAMAFWEKKKLL
jgi:ADP-ribose pyrophosphatase